MNPGRQKRTLVVCNSHLVADRLVSRLSLLRNVMIMDRLNGEEDAFQFASERNPDIVLVDTHLEIGNGMSLIRRIKGLRKAPVVVAVSILSTRQHVHKGMKEGADHFFKLPEEFDELLELMEE